MHIITFRISAIFNIQFPRVCTFLCMSQHVCRTIWRSSRFPSYRSQQLSSSLQDWWQPCPCMAWSCILTRGGEEMKKGHGHRDAERLGVGVQALRQRNCSTPDTQRVCYMQQNMKARLLYTMNKEVSLLYTMNKEVEFVDTAESRRQL